MSGADIDKLIQWLRQKRITFSLHDSVGNDHIWMDMWFWHSEDVKAREDSHLSTKVQVSAKDLEALFHKAMDKLGV
jgi:hypothetical protein